jgi:hypothetical protein
MFTDTERAIFQYFNGVKNVFGDPLKIRRRLYNLLGGDPNEVLNQANNGVPEVKDKATEKLMAAVIYAFDMVPFDKESGKGALEYDCRAALDSFVKWIEEKKNPVENLLTSPLGLDAFQALSTMQRSSGST